MIAGANALGEALGNALAAALGPPVSTFEGATKRLGARITVRFADGREISCARPVARGSIGWGELAQQQGLVRDKFSATGGQPEVADALDQLETLSNRELVEIIRVALRD